ncbi:MAG: heavy-metal-associated domain-containing protein [Planctomycetota bacterium]
MRAFVYSIAVLAAAGIMYAIAWMPANNADAPAAESVAAESNEIMTEPGTLVLSVPSMHCAVACYPKVKESLESTPGISEVVLDEQKEEGVLDNRQVIVHYEAGFDLSQALANLTETGFDDAGRVQ